MKLNNNPNRWAYPYFQTTVRGGLPVGVVISEYHPPEDYGEEPEIEFFLVDSKGYKAEWLERLLSDEEMNEIYKDLVYYDGQED